ncbi:hypothetical protein BKA70DRAFT_1449332 [Coprinopsis sp. MPI-PUGE-AT-0042]|nr:hypothetical protein BKA70DRAFT_1449332 [Coprinopsis sp. MPI-PUGE-AT-0042]
MDAFYSVTSATQRLSAITTDRLGEGKDSTFLAAAGIFNASDVHLVHFPQTLNWRLCREGEDKQAEEAVFRVQGVLCGKDLPPVQKKGNSQSELRSRRFIRQNVKITGFGEAQFTKALTELEAVHLKMSNCFPDGRMEDFQPSMFGNHFAIEANTRYFNHRNTVSADVQPVDFLDGVDPEGSLYRLMGEDYVHTQDNQVDYFQVHVDAEGNKRHVKEYTSQRQRQLTTKCRYIRVSPSIFRIGDIVEAALAFVCVPLKNSRTKAVVTLKALVMLNQEDRDNAAILRMRSKYDSQATESAQGHPSLKRKAVYSDIVDTELTGRQLSRMRID